VTELLVLQAPRQHDYSNPAVELNPKRLSRWLKELPLLNLAASLGDLIESLEPLNLEPMPAKNRLRLLELYCGPILDLFAATADDCLLKLPIGTGQRHRIRDSMGRLCAALASGYKIVVRDTWRERLDPRKNPFMVVAAYRAMEIGGRTLLHAWRNYQSVPPFTYMDLHQLYRFAERHGILDAPVSYERQAISATGMGALYRRLLLLAAIDPFHLSAGVAERLFGFLEGYADACRLLPSRPGEADIEGCFLVDLETDSPPQPCSKIGREIEWEQPRVLDVTPSMDQLRQHMEKLRGPKGALQLNTEEGRLLSLLLPELERDRQRRAERRTSQREVRVCLGLSATHFFLTKGTNYLAQHLAAASTGMHVQELSSAEEARHSIDSWLILNESANGYMLTSRRRWSGDARVGDVAGVVQANPSGGVRFALATVRWVRVTADQRTEIGVEVIPGAAHPVRCIGSDAVVDGGGDLPGLFLPQVPALNLPATLVVPKRLYSRDRLIHVRTGERDMQVRAGHLLADTALFDRFEFVTV
jgi:hypothetical protein